MKEAAALFKKDHATVQAKLAYATTLAKSKDNKHIRTTKRIFEELKRNENKNIKQWQNTT